MLRKKTKIVCTIGPASWDETTLRGLIQAGMDVARLNLSHGTHEEKATQIRLIRKISKALNQPIAIIADLPGPKMRLGKIEGTRRIEKGETVQLSLNPTLDEIPIQFDLSLYIKKGHRIFLNDGQVELKVTDVKNKVIVAEAHNFGEISSNKGINIPDTKLNEAIFTQKDYEDAQFALSEGVDYLALSFVQTVEDLKPAKELIKKLNSPAKIMVKIEKKEAVENLEEIIKQTNAVIVARGDLAIEIPAAEVPLVQKKIIHLARQYRRPVVIATQMLESMIENPRPTRAEVSDVANAVMDQVDAVMLSAESASGKYPVEAVETMRNVIVSVESALEYVHYIKVNWESLAEEEIYYNAITASAASLSYRLKAKAIAVGTTTGKTARVLSAFRPNSWIIAVVHEEKTYHQMALVWGVHPMIIEPTGDFNKFVDSIFVKLHQVKDFEKGDKIIIVTGTKPGISGTTNTIKIATL